MNWKTFRIALVTLVLQSSYLMGTDGWNRAAQPPARPTTEGSEFLSDQVAPFRDVQKLPKGDEPFRQTDAGSGLSPNWWRSPPRVLSWVERDASSHPPGSGHLFSEAPATLHRGVWISDRDGQDVTFLTQGQVGSNGCVPASYTEPLTEPIDEPERVADGTPDPSFGPVRFMQPPEPLDETVEPDFQLMSESGDPPIDGPPVTYYVTPYRPIFATRFGWWFVDASGSPTKVGEYQGLKSAPFWDVDGLFSDGVRTVDLFATGLENDTSQAGLDYFGPRLSADFSLQRYLHRLDHDPLTNLGARQSGEETIREDLNVGEDYAVRVEDVRTSFHGNVTDHIKARLNFRYLRKHGERQANAMQHCFCDIQQGQGNCDIQQRNCHVLSQQQRIDWRTVKIEPVIEAKYGPVRAEYSRPMRMFDQDDQVVTREFGLHFPTERPYAFVPENFSQVDRLKLEVDLAAQTHFYARLSAGDTRNKFRETHRKYQVYDLRLTNQTWDALTLTGYLTINKQTNQEPPFLLPEEEYALSIPNSWVPPYGLRRPIDYSTTTAGAEASWQPFQRGDFARGFSLTAGCEQGSVDREFADYFIEQPQTTVDQEHTLVTAGHVGASMRFSPSLDGFVRYKYRGVQDPLFGVNRYEGVTNTNLPEHEHLVEIGGTWVPITNFIANVTVGMDHRLHQSEIADFEENSYPLTLTLWYAPTPAWSFSAGYGFYSNWIDQDILFPSDDPQVATWDRSRWNYGGRSRVLSLGAAYLWTRTITLSGGLEVVSARDAIDPLAAWPDLSSYSQVIVDRTRITAGVDWELREQISAYFRYRYEEYQDRSAAYDSGTAHMALGGLSAVY